LSLNEEADLVEAFVLIQTEVGKAAAVASALREIEGVIRSSAVTGPYDVIIDAQADDIDALGKLVASKVPSVEGIVRTVTCPVVQL
jgi:DNA-binding Lrp family transcriptional regulator